MLENLDERGLSLLAQGDWCDPLNLAGHKGKGVSGWLTIATVHALQCWAAICRDTGRHERALHWQDKAATTGSAVQLHLWDGQWFARGITDDGRVFGGHADSEGSLFLNPQSWALMAGSWVPSSSACPSKPARSSTPLSTAGSPMLRSSAQAAR